MWNLMSHLKLRRCRLARGALMIIYFLSKCTTWRAGCVYKRFRRFFFKIVLIHQLRLNEFTFFLLYWREKLQGARLLAALRTWLISNALVENELGHKFLIFMPLDRYQLKSVCFIVLFKVADIIAWTKVGHSILSAEDRDLSARTSCPRVELVLVFVRDCVVVIKRVVLVTRWDVLNFWLLNSSFSVDLYE